MLLGMDTERIKRQCIDLLRKAVSSRKSERMALYEQVAQNLVTLRERSITTTGQPDWAGRTYEYRSMVRNIYASAGLSSDPNDPIKAALRYHLGKLLRERLSADELDDARLLRTHAGVRQHERFVSQSALAAQARHLVLQISREPGYEGSASEVTAAKEIVRLLSAWLRG